MQKFTIIDFNGCLSDDREKISTCLKFLPNGNPFFINLCDKNRVAKALQQLGSHNSVSTFVSCILVLLKGTIWNIKSNGCSNNVREARSYPFHNIIYSKKGCFYRGDHEPRPLSFMIHFPWHCVTWSVLHSALISSSLNMAVVPLPPILICPLQLHFWECTSTYVWRLVASCDTSDFIIVSSY